MFVAGLGVYLRSRGYRGRVLRSRGAAAIGTPVIVLLLGAAWWYGLRDAFPMVELDPEMLRHNHEMAIAASPTAALPFAVGDEFRPSTFEGQGWLPDDPPDEDDLAGKILVVDIWNEL